MKTLVVVFISIVLIYFHIKTLVKDNNKGEAMVVLVLYLVGFTLSFLLMNGVKVPNPNKLIMNLIKMIPFINASK
jgi:hypothetical protein